MESEILITNNQPSTSKRVLAAAGPMLWIAISYIDPGKWATAVEGGARLGFDVVLLMFVINCAAILCQYLSARIAIATGKDLAQICHEEYGGTTYLLLGIQAEASMVVLDLTMVLGTAYGLNVVFGIDLYTSILLTGIDAALFPFLTSIFENPRAKFSSTCLASCILVSYVCGLLISQPENSESMGGMLNSVSIGGILNKLSGENAGENAYLLMGLLGANIMPHNFYLHSSIVQKSLGQTSLSKGALCYDHFLATFSIFSCIFLVNCLLMNWAAHVFYNTGVVSLTLPDALSLLDQVSRISSFSLVLIMFFSNQLIALPWSVGASQDFFRLDITCWLHRAAVRIVAIVLAVYCVWISGVDGIFQLLIFTQVVVALFLPSSVIPLFHVASSGPIMGAYRISFMLRLLALGSFVGMLWLKISIVIEMIFGTKVVSSLSWNFGSSLPMLYFILHITAFASLGFMFWLVITSIKSATSGVNTQALQWDVKDGLVESSTDRNQTESREVHYQQEKVIEKQEPASSLDKSVGDHQMLSIPGPTLNLLETFSDSENNLHLTTIQENKLDFTFSKPSVKDPEPFSTISEVALPEFGEVIKSEPLDASTLNTESRGVVQKTNEGDVQNEKEDDGYSWEPEESSKFVTESNRNLNSEGSGSFKNLSGKLDDVGSGTGSLSRLAGLGRAARRQLTAALDEFWGHLFDLHGQVTQDARAKKLDNLLGIDSKVDSKTSFAPVKMESLSKDSTGYFPSTGARGSDSFKTSSLYNSSMQQTGQSNVGSPLGAQQKSLMWSNHMQHLDAYVRNASQNTIDSGERRYYSVHVPSSTEAYDQQPATIHGYDLASILGQMAKGKGSDNLNAQLESLTRTPAPTSKSNAIDPYSQSLGQKSQNGLRMLRPPGFHNVPVSRNTSLKSERPFQDISSPEPVDYANNPANVKKYYSLPDISGLYVPNQNSSLSGKSSQLDYSIGYGQSINRQAREQRLSSASSWADTGLGSNELSPSKVCRDAFPLQFASSSGTASLWSKQPYERFGVADKSPPKIQETASIVDMEAKILQSFRSCIHKLLKLEGSDWLFRQNDGADEDLIDRVAAREKFLYEVEIRTSARKPDEVDHSKITSVPNCGDTCVWRVDLIISFGVWCIHRILELSLMESRPELWGKYTYVLNRLQGIIDPAFSKPRCFMAPCFCLHLPAGYQQKLSPPISNDGLPPPGKLGRGKFTSKSMLLDMIKDVEIAISCRKGRTGTAAGDVAFPKGKENLASVLKRYKRRLSNKPVVLYPQEASGPCKTASSTPHGGF